MLRRFTPPPVALIVRSTNSLNGMPYGPAISNTRYSSRARSYAKSARIASTMSSTWTGLSLERPSWNTQYVPFFAPHFCSNGAV